MRGYKELGPLCLRGHEHEDSGQSLRYVSNNACAVCVREFNNEATRSGANKNRWNKRLNDPFAAAIHAMQGRKCRRGMTVTITKSDLEELWKAQDGRCYWLGIELDLVRGDNPYLARGHSPRKATVDRLDNDLGYVKGNIVWASAFANLGRQRTSVEEFRGFLKELGIQPLVNLTT